VQADYFARRIAGRDLTGIDGPADNEKGLEDARRWLARLDGSGQNT
jgi:homoserine kinase type II